MCSCNINTFITNCQWIKLLAYQWIYRFLVWWGFKGTQCHSSMGQNFTIIRGNNVVFWLLIHWLHISSQVKKEKRGPMSAPPNPIWICGCNLIIWSNKQYSDRNTVTHNTHTQIPMHLKTVPPAGPSIWFIQGMTQAASFAPEHFWKMWPNSWTARLKGLNLKYPLFSFPLLDSVRSGFKLNTCCSGAKCKQRM